MTTWRQIWFDRESGRLRSGWSVLVFLLLLGMTSLLLAPAIAAIGTTLFLPWTSGTEVSTSLPATTIAHFFGDSFERRTNQRLGAGAGDAQLASLI